MPGGLDLEQIAESLVSLQAVRAIGGPLGLMVTGG